ncbi:Gfo/Idh/MocA family protein [Pedobacter faecalis]|uniref:Gfo/Idh/MocA family protein n=1 Tax=Pedobacter faecalis TaxID=3041495 RepID=UPI00254C08C2|nr:Gfo/Idh/MocA family oxidoreductase [Pedobacter sp. ELA7]
MHNGIRVKIYMLFAGIAAMLSGAFSSGYAQSSAKPLRLAVAGTAHGHVPWILNRKGKTDVELVGVFEPVKALAEKRANSYKLDPKLFYSDLGKMLDEVKPEAVVAFGSVYDHLMVVEACAPRGIHVMVEKPLAASLPHARKMETLAKKHKIHLLTNFETSWYPSTAKAYQLVNDSNYVGRIRKVVVHDGHQGPREIGVGQEFFDFLTDPVGNGGGALVDFGCYGANLMTYLMKGQEPVSVTAVTRQYKPEIYPKVEDDATIIVNYPDAQCIIQASWNWPFNRKDMEVYGETGYVITVDQSNMRIRAKNDRKEQAMAVTTKEMPVYEDPFAYLADVLKGKIKDPDFGLYALENNMTVVRILEAAKESARTGKTVPFKR